MLSEYVAPLGEFAARMVTNKYAHTKPSGYKEDWSEIADRQVACIVKPLAPKYVEPIRRAILQRKLMPGGRYLYAVGRRYAQICNCFLFRADDSREGWADLDHDVTACLMTGGGVGTSYSQLRPDGMLIEGMGGRSSGPIALINIQNEKGRFIRQGGSRRSALWAGLTWKHPDIFTFIKMKDYPQWVKDKKKEDFNFPAPMDGTNVSVSIDNDFFEAYYTPGWRKSFRWGSSSYEVTHETACNVYWSTVRRMLIDGEPGFSVNCGSQQEEDLRNACTEVVSATNGDMCNLLSLNLARINSLEEFVEMLHLGTLFVLLGSIYTKLPVSYMNGVRDANRRLGLGLMGIHEWLLLRGHRYGPCEGLGRWMAEYAKSTQIAHKFSEQFSVSKSIATRAIAPTGTISMVAETTSGIEPISAVAYKRRYLDGKSWKMSYVVDPTAQRLINRGMDPSVIEDSYVLAHDVDRRINFQAWMQQFVDQGISATINLPPWGTTLNNEGTVTQFGTTLLKYLPKLRGITAYPDGSRGGQPITSVPYSTAVSYGLGECIEESELDLDLKEESLEIDCKAGICST